MHLVEKEAVGRPNSLRGTIGVDHAEIHVRGKAVCVPSAQIESRTVITTGNWLKVAAVRNEELVEGNTVGIRLLINS